MKFLTLTFLTFFIIGCSFLIVNLLEENKDVKETGEDFIGPVRPSYLSYKYHGPVPEGYDLEYFSLTGEMRLLEVVK